MCVIIDTCAFRSVFNKDAKHHVKFAPVFDWITNKRGKIVVGGTTYLKEMADCGGLSVLAEYERMNRLATVSTKQVDDYEKKLKSTLVHRDFDDPHLVALVVVSKCQVVCTEEKRAIPFLTRKDLYPKKFKRPRIYRSSRNADLCCHENVVGACSS